MRVAGCNCTVGGMQRTIIHSFKVVHQGQDVLMSHRYLFEDSNLIPDLSKPTQHPQLLYNFHCFEFEAHTICSLPCIILLLITLAA